MSGRTALPAGQELSGSATKAAAKPRLVLFHSRRSGECRRAEAYLAQTLQRRRNHATFELVRVDVEERTDLAERFGVVDLPTLVVVEGRRVVRRIVAPHGPRDLERALKRWLR